MKQMIQNTRKLFRSDQEKKIFDWLSPPNPSTNRDSAKERRLEGTGRWFLESQEFLIWESNKTSALWIHGIPGCGKTILTSTIIQHLDRTPERAGFIYFFFDFRDNTKQSFEEMVRSFIFQLADLKENAKENLRNLYRNCREGKDQPDLTSLCSMFQRMSKEIPDLTVVLDALDECERGSREPLIEWLGTLECRILMTSRMLEDIQSSIEEWKRPTSIFSIRKDDMNMDIRAYVRERLGLTSVGTHVVSRASGNSKLAKKWKNHAEVLTRIEKKLTDNADGM